VLPLAHIVLWLTLLGFAIVFVRTIGPFKKIDNTLMLPIIIGTLINALVFYSTTLYLIPRFASKNQIKNFFLGIIIVFLGFTILETIIDYFFLVWIYSDSSEPFFGMLITNGLIHLIFISLAIGYGFIRSWVVNEKNKQVLIREKLTAELSFLRTQLNPHFLFNVLNMAYSSASQRRRSNSRYNRETFCPYAIHDLREQC